MFAGSVDDHFAKSLGNSTWTALKAKKDPVNELFTGSVDDHFAKALGDTWLRIKAEKENGHCTSLSQQRHDTSLLSTQHWYCLCMAVFVFKCENEWGKNCHCHIRFFNVEEYKIYDLIETHDTIFKQEMWCKNIFVNVIL